MASNFESLPLELVEHIARFCEPRDIFSLRLVCESLRRKTLEHFGRRFFTRISTDLTRSSLAKIHGLAGHEHLRHKVKCMVFTRPHNLDTLDRGELICWSRLPWLAIETPCDRPELRQLRDDLSNDFHNCRSFFIVFRGEHQGTLEEKSCHRRLMGDAIRVFLAIITDAQIMVESFHLVFGEAYGFNSRYPMADIRGLPRFLHRDMPFRAAWSQLQTLELEHQICSATFYLLIDFILCAPKLHTLFLTDTSDSDRTSHTDEFIYYLSRMEDLPKLRELGLFRLHVRGEDLLRLISRLESSLSSLHLFAVRLGLLDDWVSILRYLQRTTRPLQVVSLHHLAIGDYKTFATFPGLDSVIPSSDTHHPSAKLSYSSHGSKTDVVGVSYSGASMDEVLKSLERTILPKEFSTESLS